MRHQHNAIQPQHAHHVVQDLSCPKNNASSVLTLTPTVLLAQIQTEHHVQNVQLVTTFSQTLVSSVKEIVWLVLEREPVSDVKQDFIWRGNQEVLPVFANLVTAVAKHVAQQQLNVLHAQISLN